MKKTIKKTLNVLTLIVILITFSCTQDLYQEETHTKENQEFMIKKVNFNEISSNKKLTEKLGKLISKKEATVNPEGKIVYSSEYGFYVDTDYANYIEDENGKHSYIFKVYRDSVQNKLDNIVFSSQEDNTYKVVLISYDLTSLEQQNLENGISINVSDNPRAAYLIEDENLTSDIFNKTLIVYEGNGCITIMETSCSYGNAIHPDGFHNGANCPGYTETVWWTDCGDSGGGGGTSGGYNNPTGNTGSTTTGTSGTSPSGGSGGSSNNTSSNSNDTIYTTPTYPSPQQILKDKFIKQLTGDFINPNNQKDCFNNLPQEQKDEILDAVGSLAIQLNENGSTQNSCGNSTTEEEQFNEIEEVMAAMCGNPDMDFDVAKSLKSPANIDFSAIDTNTSEGILVDCVFKKLMKTCEFKELFTDVFSDNEKLNVKFEFVTNLPISKGASTGDLSWEWTGNNVTNVKQTLKLNKNWYSGINSKPDIKIAMSILHECIHAYLNVKYAECRSSASANLMNVWGLDELINQTFSTIPNCEFALAPANQQEHYFMFDNLVPKISTILTQLKDDLISSSDQADLLNSTYQNPTTLSYEPFIWSDFFKYLSMDGLNLTSGFVSEITNIPLEDEKYSFYSLIQANDNATKNNCND